MSQLMVPAAVAYYLMKQRAPGSGLGLDFAYNLGAKEGYQRGYEEGLRRALRKIDEMIELFEPLTKQKYETPEEARWAEEAGKILYNMGIAYNSDGELLSDSYYDDEAAKIVIKTLEMLKKMILENLDLEFFRKYKIAEEED